MKSVGEVMAIGRTFKEALQKGVRGLEIKRHGFGGIPLPEGSTLEQALARPTADRLFHVYEAFKEGWSVEKVAAASRIDPWFLQNLAEIVAFEKGIRVENLREAKQMGFSDAQIGARLGKSAAEVRALRKARGIEPVYKLVDTCAAEFEALTPYYYSSYETPFSLGSESESRPSARRKIMILGGGPNRIGQGIEFDYCCVHAAFALREIGCETIMVNSNPETVSTDFDTSDKLYFEPLTHEDVMAIVERERPDGVIVQLGGQTPLNLAVGLERAGVPIIGTSPDSIDRAEDRRRFAELVERLGLRQPPNGSAVTVAEALVIAREIGYPVLVRPSYVLGGRAMEIVYDDASLEHYMARAAWASPERPVLVDRFIEDALEVDVDLVGDGENLRDRRHHGAHRGGGRALGRRGHGAAVAHARAARARRDPPLHGGHGPGAAGERPDERAVRRAGTRRLRARGESPGLPHRAVRVEGHRRAARQDRREGHGGRRASRSRASRRK